MMVLSGILKSTNQTPSHPSATATPDSTSLQKLTSTPYDKGIISPTVTASSSNTDSKGAPYIRAKENLIPLEAEIPDLRELNHSLEALAAIFPDVQVEVFREMLSSFEEESRLAVVTEALLKHKMKYVRGRFRVASKEQERDTAVGNEDEVKQQDSKGHVPVEEKFRSEGYKKAVKTVAYHEFKGLPRSTINAVLAERNHSYTLARPTLVDLSSKSWRFSISSFFSRRKPLTAVEAGHHPLVIWQSAGQVSVIPTIKTTGSPELDKELFDSLIIPLQERALLERDDKDHALALEINNREAEEQEALYDCECCYTSCAFEELSACDIGGHFICFQCIRHAGSEAIFGQGWQRNIDLKSGTLRCLAAMSDECKGCVPQEQVRRAFLENKDEEILRKLDERLIEDNLLKTGLPLIRCPFCNYAEIDEIYLPGSQQSWRFKRLGPSSIYTILFSVLGFGMIPFLLPLCILLSSLFLCLSSKRTFGDYAVDQFKGSMIRLRRRQHGLKFVCQNQRCRRASCISCSKAWNDIHICHESSLLALRTQVELAMSLAIKRTCPRCNTSFVKSSGCNKLTCVCGYQMCYVCRKDLVGSGEGYRHFCEHFRPSGGRRCTECSKCDLYRCEDDEVVVKKAKEKAEKEWMDKEGGVIGGDEKVRKVLEQKWNRGRGVAWWQGGGWWCWTFPNVEQILDTIVEGAIE